MVRGQNFKPKLSSSAQQTDREADRVTRQWALETRDMVTRSAFTGLGTPHMCTALCAFPLKKGRPLRRRYSLPVSPAAFPDYPCPPPPGGTEVFALAALLEGMQAGERGKEPLDTRTMRCSQEKAQTPSQSTAWTVPPKLTRGLGWESRVPGTRAVSGGQSSVRPDSNPSTTSSLCGALGSDLRFSKPPLIHLEKRDKTTCWEAGSMLQETTCWEGRSNVTSSTENTAGG